MSLIDMYKENPILVSVIVWGLLETTIAVFSSFIICIWLGHLSHLPIRCPTY